MEQNSLTMLQMLEMTSLKEVGGKILTYVTIEIRRVCMTKGNRNRIEALCSG